MASRRVALLMDPRAWAVPYVALWVAVAFGPFPPTDLDNVFWRSAKIALDGHPLMVYSVRLDVYPNANGPLALIPLTAVGVVVRVLGWLDTFYPRRAVAFALFSVFVLLMARESVAAVERLRGLRIEGYPRLLSYAMFTLAPPVWLSVAGYGHIEQPIEIWFLLIAVRWMDRNWILRSGAAFGLAVLSRSSAVLLSIPLALASLNRSPAITARFLAAVALTGAAGVLPFYLADKADLIYSLITYRGGLPVGAGSIWSVTRGGALEPVVQHWDIVAVVAAAISMNLWLATRRGGLGEAGLFAAMSLTSASFVLLAKTVWPYYFFEVFVVATIWAVGTWRTEGGLARLVLAPVAISTISMVSEIGSPGGPPPLTFRFGDVVVFFMLGLLMVWIIWQARGAASASRAYPVHEIPPSPRNC